MKNLNIILIIIILILILFGIWGLVYYFSQTEKSSKVENANSVSGYYTYKNNKYNINFDYPSRLFINTFNESSVNIGDEAGFWHIILYIDPGPVSLEYWMEENKDLWKKGSELTIDGERAIKLNDIGTGEGSGNEFIIVTIKGDNLYRILYRYLNDENVDKIINSFKFYN